MPFLHDDVLDNGIKYIDDYGEDLWICSSEPATYAEATSTYGLGYKLGITISAPQAGDSSGRKVAISAITDGTVSGTGSAGYWAIIDETNDKLLAADELDAAESVTSGNTFTLGAFDIEVPDPS